MRRISTNMPTIDMQYYLRLREWRMNELQNKMASQSRIKELRDDPMAASRATRFQTSEARLRKYSRNIEMLRNNAAVTEGYLNEAADVLQRMREIAIQGATGTLQQSDMAILGDEVNQLLNELVTIGNARSADGKRLFSGYDTGHEPFRATWGLVSRDHPEMIVGVDYVGNIGRNQVEISPATDIAVNLPGNHAFWAEKQSVYSAVDATDYRVRENSHIRVDGIEIQLTEGDNVYAIIHKINSSGAAVRARLDPVQASLVLETTTAHELWLEDLGGTSVLQDLGVLSDATPPLNSAESARVFGGSVFDMAIHLRDALYRGDSTEVNAGGIRGMDDALASIITSRAELGAKDARLAETYKRLTFEIPVFVNMNSQEVDLDISEAITNLKMLEYTHEAALSTAAKIMQLSLLNFLR